MNTTSPQTTRHHVVVGVDGSGAGLRAARFAAHEARRLGTGLSIVHVTPTYTVTGPALPIVPDLSLREYAGTVLDEALAAAKAAEPQVEADTVHFTGSRVSGLVETARDAALLVVGSEHRSLGERIWTGATLTGVAARSKCPVAVVPASWDPEKRTGRVLVGYKGPRHAPEAFNAAFELARDLGAEVHVLHAWQLESGYDSIVSNRVALEEFRTRALAVIEPQLAEYRAAYPDIAVTVEVVHGQPAHALVNGSAHADRLVLGRPVHGGIVHHLGAVARAALRESHCPIQVVLPVSSAPQPTGLELEHGGALQR